MVFRKIIFVLFTLAMVACEQPSGDSEGGSQDPPEKNPTLLSGTVVPIYLGVTTSYIRASLNCRNYAVIEFTYQSSLTPKTTIFRTCPSNSLSQQLILQQGTTPQLVQIKIMGYMEQPAKPIPLPYNLTSNFNPGGSTPSAYASKAVTSGGGPLTGAGVSVKNSSIGEVFVGTSNAPDGSSARNGLQGAIDP